MSEKTELKKLVIIDGKSVFYRGYYAMGALSRADGTPTGGVYGFAAIAMEIVKELQPDKVVVAWDSRTSTAKRKAIYSEYKAGRKRPGEDFYAQIPLLEELICDLGWGFVECEEYEADDIIGTLARQATTPAASADARLAHRTISTPRSDAPASLHKPSSDAPDWVVYIISSDLDMLQVVDKNVHLYRIIKGFSQLEDFDVPALEKKCGIKQSQFLDLKALKGDASDNIPGVPGVGEKTAVKLLNEYEDLDGIYTHIEEIGGAVQKKLVAGKESAYMSRELGQIMFDAPVSLDEVPDFVIDRPRIAEGLKKLEFNSLIKKFGLSSDVKSDLLIARHAQGRLPKLIVSQQVNPDLTTLPSGTIFAIDIKELMHQDEEVAKEILHGAGFWDLGQAEFLLNPLAREKITAMDNAGAIYARQKEEFACEPGLYKIFTEYDQPLIPVLYKMEKRGMLIDKDYFEQMWQELAGQVDGLQREIWRLAGMEFNVNSPVQLSEVLFGKLQLPTKGIKKTARGYSTGAKELAKLAEEHEIIEKIMEYREVSKLLSTYVAPLPELADAEGRIHTTFTQNVTTTGRLSSVNPNLQNIPVRTEEGKKIRGGFVAGPGKKLVSADYSQFELRLAAVLAGDQQLTEDFNAGVDIHTKTAAEVYGVEMGAVTKNMRRAAKVINFGVLYGMSAKGLSDATGMTVPEAKRFIDGYFELRKPIRVFLDRVLEQARNDGYVETYYGRRRPTPDVKSSNFLVRMGAERAAQNMPIQGTEADLMKRAMIRVDSVLPNGAELVLQVHDSLVVECDDALVEEVAEILQREMEGVAPELAIKLAVEVTVGKNWGEL